MKEIRKTSQFKKDYKRFKNDKEFVETLMGIVKLLAEGNQIPEEYNPHPLKGNWKNYMECHIENDTLLIWFDKNNNAIELVRLGSHSELFGKGRKRWSLLSSRSPMLSVPANMARAWEWTKDPLVVSSILEHTASDGNVYRTPLAYHRWQPLSLWSFIKRQWRS